MTTLRPTLLRHLLPRTQTRSYAAKRLAKPTKFTPPSHHSRKPLADPVNYPGPPIKQDPKKHYPNTLPPPDTWAHFMLTSRHLHFYVSIGILAVLAGTVSVANFVKTSPFASEIVWEWEHPVDGARSFGAAWKKSVEEESRRTGERRKRMVDDVEKRGEFRRAHGLEQTGEEGGFGGFGTKPRGEDAKTRVMVEAARKKLVEEAERGGESAAWVEEEVRKLEEAAAARG